MMKIKKIGIVANVKKEKASDYTRTLRDWLRQRGLEVVLEKGIAERVCDEEGMERRTLAAHVDLLIVFGGDGTILRTARFALGCATPIVGINLGGLGYLTEVNLNEMYEALEIILTGDFETDQRMMLDAALNDQEGDEKMYTVLNDIVLNRAHLSRIVELETYVDGRYLITYKADGLIVATPTGSTAYSLSAGGPIVFPQQDVIIINPICPHTLTNRPIILPADVSVQVILRTKEQGAMLTLDGQVSLPLKSGDTLKIKKSPHITTHRDYLEILRTKLGWVALVTQRNDTI
jgi:NAD+ kinase